MFDVAKTEQDSRIKINILTPCLLSGKCFYNREDVAI
jgi:hypothetical protein